MAHLKGYPKKGLNVSVVKKLVYLLNQFLLWVDCLLIDLFLLILTCCSYCYWSAELSEVG